MHTPSVVACTPPLPSTNNHLTPVLYATADETTHHLENVKQVLELLGYTPTNTPADANLIWAWRDPFSKPTDEQPKLAAVHDHLRSLQRYQFVNHVPAAGWLATKSELAKLSAVLNVLPRTFQLPQEYKAWQEFLQTEQGAKMEWIQKSKGHR